jgi:hypothetical protein
MTYLDMLETTEVQIAGTYRLYSPARWEDGVSTSSNRTGQAPVTGDKFLLLILRARKDRERLNVAIRDMEEHLKNSVSCGG